MSKDYTKAIVKINRETKEGKITWDVVSVRPTSLSTSEIIRGYVYASRVLDRDVIFYKCQYKQYTDEDEFHWIDIYKLDFVDRRNISQFTFPYNNALEDLYESVQFKHAEVGGFLDEWLGDEEDEIDF